MSDLLILKDHFQRSFVGAGLAVPSGVFDALVSRYGEPGRAYHTLQHIGEGIGHLKTGRSVAPEIPIAWWFHDAIYDPRRQDNEDKSAAWAGAVLGTGPLRGRVETLILATKAAFTGKTAKRSESSASSGGLSCGLVLPDVAQFGRRRMR